MPNHTTRTHLSINDSPLTDTTPRFLTKQEFSRRLYSSMLGKGWTQAELARRSQIDRSVISGYILGRNMPSPLKLKQLCKALDMTEQALLPNYIENAIDKDTPALDFKASTSVPGKSWLRVNRLVDNATALKVAELIHHDIEADDRSRSRRTLEMQQTSCEAFEAERKDRLLPHKTGTD